MGDINKIEEECTHNCMTCGHGCAEGSDGVGKFEKALNRLSDIDTEDLLKGLQSLADTEDQ